MKGKLIRFVKNYAPYVAGDIAGFSNSREADRFLSLEVAVEHFDNSIEHVNIKIIPARDRMITEETLIKRGRRNNNAGLN